MNDNKNKTILIIDDEEIVRLSITDSLKEDGYNFIEAVNGQEGLDALEKDSPVLIIVDLRMPVISGLEFLEKIQPKASDPYSIIVLTGHGTEADMQACFDIGVTAFLNKPFNVLNLRGLVKQNIALKTYQTEIEYHRYHLQEIINHQIRDIEEKNTDLNDANEKLSYNLNLLAESETRYRMLVESAPVAIVIHQDQKLVYVNKEAIRLFKAENEQDLLGKNPLDFVHPDFHAIVTKRNEKTLQTGTGVPLHREQMLDLRGNTIEIDICSIPISYNNKPAVQVIGIDSTDRVKLEEQLRQSHKMEAVGQLAGGIAHDFNNILTGIMGYAEIGKMIADDPNSVKSHFESISSKSDEAAQLVKQLMVFSRKQKVIIETVNLHVLIQELIDFMRKSLRDNIEIEGFNSHDNACFADVDVVALRQILSNLMLNAQHAMPDGGKITISGDIINISKKDCEGYKEVSPGEFIKLSISDTGSGIPDEIINRIFDPFFTTKEVSEGTGLGLSMVYSLMEKHHGYVTVESSLDEGTTFYLHFPKSKSRIETAEMDRENLIHTGKGTVLIVEDDLDILTILKALLDMLGYEIKVANNGKEALNILKNNDFTVDLVISDVVM
ncbi:MAG TPA: response regulator, partial [Candidatus Marinimicrobia bacterium]|nr:response regulator [Candidatus Neomarinimicrobiota bacterium]